MQHEVMYLKYIRELAGLWFCIIILSFQEKKGRSMMQIGTVIDSTYFFFPFISILHLR